MSDFLLKVLDLIQCEAIDEIKIVYGEDDVEGYI